MSKIRLITDSASDIPMDLQEKYDIDILNFPIIIDGKEYRERKDFSNDTFYGMMKQSVEIPKTSQLTAFELREIFGMYYEEGYTDIIYVVISSTGSATYNNAVMAKQSLYEEIEGASSMRIHLVDSKNYTAVYGYPVVEAAKKLQRGAEVKEILDYLEEWFRSASVYFVPMTLKYVKKSGRVSAAAAFAGELMGLRPMIRISDGVSSVIDKYRGEKNIFSKFEDFVVEHIRPHTPYILLYGESQENLKVLEKSLTKRLGYKPEMNVQIGAAVSCNAGPDIIGIVFRDR